MGGIFNIVMRIVSSLLGLLVVAMGGIWILQALKMEPAIFSRSAMVGDSRWAIYGAILVLVGLAQVWWSNSRQR